MRFIATGGVLKGILKPEDEITTEEMISSSEEVQDVGEGRVAFQFKPEYRKYVYAPKYNEYWFHKPHLMGFSFLSSNEGMHASSFLRNNLKNDSQRAHFTIGKSNDCVRASPLKPDNGKNEN